MVKDHYKHVLEFIKEHPSLSSSEIHSRLDFDITFASIKRILTKLVSEELILPIGRGKGTKYIISSTYEMLHTVDVDSYFEKEIDERVVKENFNLTLIKDVLSKMNLFTEEEKLHLEDLHKTYKKNISELSEAEYSKELERLAIDLSWKSSQIEGNTYSLLETERLLRDKETALGKAKDDATMLLNHKDALDFIIEDPTYTFPLTVSRIEDIHSLLIKDLNIDRNIRKRRVGITGTNYKPLDNEFQIKEALRDTCDLINSKENVWEKALLMLLLISYIQPFSDGNKRTARIMSNAILIYHGFCPISFRTIDSIDYKKAMLLFYEQNNIVMFKRIFISQYEFAVKTYF